MNPQEYSIIIAALPACPKCNGIHMSIKDVQIIHRSFPHSNLFCVDMCEYTDSLMFSKAQIRRLLIELDYPFPIPEHLRQE